MMSEFDPRELLGDDVKSLSAGPRIRALISLKIRKISIFRRLMFASAWAVSLVTLQSIGSFQFVVDLFRYSQY